MRGTFLPEPQQHTPGPWRIDPGNPHLVLAGDTPIAGAGARQGFNPLVVWGEQQANARLIAAAPDLLASLNEIKAALSSGTYCVHRCDGEMMSLVGDGFTVSDIFERADAAIAKAGGRQ